MIIGKLEKARTAYKQAVNECASVLETQRGSAEARAEMVELREYVEATNTCPYCGGDASVRSERHSECCRSCGKTLDRMLTQKSRILSGYDDPSLVQRLLEGYATFTVRVPYALRGATGDAADVIKALDSISVAAANYHLEKRAAAAREAAINIAEKRKREIRALVLKVHPDLDQETLEEKVNEYYVLEEMRQYEKTSH